MQTFARTIIRHPVPIVAMTFLVCAAAYLVHARRQSYDFSFEAMAPRDTVAYRNFKEFEEVFGTDESLYLLAFRTDPLITNANLDLIGRITEQIEALPETQSLTTLTNARDIVGADATLDVREFLPPPTAEGYSLGDEEARALTDRLVNDPVIGGNLISRDGRTNALVGRMAHWNSEPRDRVAYFTKVQRILEEEGATDIDFHISGIPYLDGVMMTHIENDTARFIPITILVLGSFVYLAFRQFRTIWMAVLPPAIASVLALGLLSALGMSMTVLTGEGVLSTLIMVVGLSDAIHLLNRYGEDVRADPAPHLRDRYRALTATIGHIGRACFLTSATTAIGFLSLTTTDIPTIRQFGFIGAAGIMFAYGGAIVFMPATIVLVERVRLSPVPRMAGRGLLDRGLAGVSRLAVAAPRTIVMLGVGVLIGAALSATRIEIDNRFTEDLKPNDPGVLAMRFLERNLGGTYPLEVVIRGDQPDTLKQPQVLEGVDHVRAALEALPHISKVNTPVEFIKKMNRAMHDGDRATYAVPPTSDAVAQYLLLFEMGGGDSEFDRLITYDYSYGRMQAMMEDIEPATYHETIEVLREAVGDRFPAGVEVYESGGEPLFYAASERLMSTLVRSLYLAMPIIFLITALAFRSFKLAAISILPNIIPITVGMGVMGAADISLRFATIIGFPVAFGLAIDDTIHFLARYRTEISGGATPEEAVRATLATTGRAMVLTTLFLVGGYCVMLTSGFLAIVHMSVVVIVILAAALVGDLLILPALLVWLRPRLSA